MPRVYTQKANKDYPDQGIKKGDTYYSWSFRYGGDRKSKTQPRPSQLTQSKMSTALAAAESVEDAIASASCPDDLLTALNDAAEEIRGVADEYQEAADAFENGGGIADQNTEKADQVNEWADQLESDAGEIESLSVEDYIDEDVEVEGKKGDARNVSNYDELTSDEQSEMLAAAIEIAGQSLSAPF